MSKVKLYVLVILWVMGSVTYDSLQQWNCHGSIVKGLYGYICVKEHTK